ncbi:L-aspartate oxidase [Parvularcula sp. LCG005]|uniref:L-aspartate oxidase n=1 Tax=Parvularcula sp. LCG005 TaxID=3078805 RepID=UPI0029430634|nr:L-aspartate oxidase [Parvularcula sp. LCG005]WOI52787.1 L-aspartate oxidase [Parvularcula sp. LCG005]
MTARRAADGGVLIIGAGVAGLYAALKMAPHPVTVISARPVGQGGSSPWAQGGLAAAMGQEDSPALHMADTIAAGAGLVDEEAARILCEAGPARIRDLLAMGVPFDHTADGQLKLGREAAHGLDRIVHVGGDEAGATIMRVLLDRAREAEHIDLHERMIAHQLLTEDDRVVGARVWDVETQSPLLITAQETVMATGGIGGLYAVTTNPLRAQGLGLAMAYDVGAVLRDMEFVQFHPTGVDIGKDPAPLATEALRGEGCTLHDAHGRRFMTAIHPDAELAPRDVVARGVAKAIAETGEAFLDARQAIGLSFKDRFPTVYAACMEAGINPAIHPIPIAPAAHYHMGGILTDLDGRSTKRGLWAVGEASSTGVHGANRLASNSLLEALVFGDRAAKALLKANPESVEMSVEDPAPPRPIKPADNIGAVRKSMSLQCGLLRSDDGLDAVLSLIGKTETVTQGDYLALLAARLVTQAARQRLESRGAHQRSDFPDLAPPVHSLTVKGEDGNPVIRFAEAHAKASIAGGEAP